MRFTPIILAAFCVATLTARAGDKPVGLTPGEAVPAKIVSADHLGVFKADRPAVLPMVVVSFQTQATEKGGGSGVFSSGALQYTLDGISGTLMQKIANEAQEAVESELNRAGWVLLPVEKAAETEAYKSWSQTPDPSGEEVKRQFFSAGKGTNSLTSKEMERVFVGGGRPLVGNGIVLGGWAAAPALCKIGQALGARVILVRFIVNFANITTGKRSVFTGHQEWQSGATLEVSYAEMDVYPPDPNGATPARLKTDTPVTLRSSFVKDVQRSGSHFTIVADPDRYEKDSVEAIRCVARGFVAMTGK
jgi:hypothetical protein